MDLTQFAWLRQNRLAGNRDSVRILFSQDIPRRLNYRNVRYVSCLKFHNIDYLCVLKIETIMLNK